MEYSKTEPEIVTWDWSWSGVCRWGLFWSQHSRKPLVVRSPYRFTESFSIESILPVSVVNSFQLQMEVKSTRFVRMSEYRTWTL